jgi:PAB-dependent poly(A)-specific ribonuclease subunit 3
MSLFGSRTRYDHDPRWAETGDRYIIKLFRDYVFHQIDEHGRPVIDLSHVLTCLNKLDAGVDEQIVLVSRDEQSCLIVSYREIRTCLENSFRELAR